MPDKFDARTVYKLLSFGFVFDTTNTGLLLYIADLKANEEPLPSTFLSSKWCWGLPIGSDGKSISILHLAVIHNVRFANASFGANPSGTTYRALKPFNNFALSLNAHAVIKHPL